MEEEWRDVLGFEGLYKVSNTGKVVNLQTNRELKNLLHSKGFLYVNLYKNKNHKTFLINRLVAQAFITDFTPSSKAIHIDGNKLNNNITNLKNVCIQLKKKVNIQKIINFESEEWKSIKGFDTSYQISNYGRIKSFKYFKEWILLKPSKDQCGYSRITLQTPDHKTKLWSIHRLVAQTFIDNPNNLPEVNHIDGDKLNNKVENLEFCTHKQNINHLFSVYKHGHIDNDIPQRKLTESEILSIFKLSNEEKYTLKQIGDMFDVSSSTVIEIKNGSTWSWLTKKQYVKNSHTNSKLSEKDAIDIFYLSWSGKLSQPQIAEMYGISHSRVSAIKLKKSFVNVTKDLNENEIPEKYFSITTIKFNY